VVVNLQYYDDVLVQDVPSRLEGELGVFDQLAHLIRCCDDDAEDAGAWL